MTTSKNAHRGAERGGADVWYQVQKVQYDQGGYIIWTNADWVDGLSKKVQGLKPSAAGALGNYRFLRRMAVGVAT